MKLSKFTLRRSPRCISLGYPGFYFGLRQLYPGETRALLSYDNNCGVRSFTVHVWPVRVQILW